MGKAGNPDIIQHDGTVESIGNNSVVVSITSASACSGCHAEGICSLSGKEDKNLTIPGRYDLITGDRVSVVMEKSMGYKAVLLGYVIPFFVLVAGLSIMVSVSVPELLAGIMSISFLIPYYLIIYIFRKQINKSFTFKIKTI